MDLREERGDETLQGGSGIVDRSLVQRSPGATAPWKGTSPVSSCSSARAMDARASHSYGRVSSRPHHDAGERSARLGRAGSGPCSIAGHTGFPGENEKLWNMLHYFSVSPKKPSVKDSYNTFLRSREVKFSRCSWELLDIARAQHPASRVGRCREWRTRGRVPDRCG
jgi:hypothetical protein